LKLGKLVELSCPGEEDGYGWLWNRKMASLSNRKKAIIIGHKPWYGISSKMPCIFGP
jgi:hypothetical protein